MRDVRVVYALKQRHYDGLLQCHAPQAHEYFMPMDKLVAQDAPDDPDVQALMARASSQANFMVAP